MSKPTTLTELLTAIGDEELSYQYLNDTTKGVSNKKDHSELTFITEAKNANGVTLTQERVGIVVWMDIDAYQAVMNP